MSKKFFYFCLFTVIAFLIIFVNKQALASVCCLGAGCNGLSSATCGSTCLDGSCCLTGCAASCPVGQSNPHLACSGGSCNLVNGCGTDSCNSDAQCCVPSCGGKVCGSNGCGGSCGSCGDNQTCSMGSCKDNVCDKSCTGTKPCGATCDNCTGNWSGGTNCGYNETCSGGRCVAACTPNCDSKDCGSNGCGGSCGSCGANETCVNSNCIPNTGTPCVPNCIGKTCGSDGCNGSCGPSCGANETCSNGNCITNPVITCNPACAAPSECINGVCVLGASNCTVGTTKNCTVPATTVQGTSTCESGPLNDGKGGTVVATYWSECTASAAPGGGGCSTCQNVACDTTNNCYLGDNGKKYACSCNTLLGSTSGVDYYATCFGYEITNSCTITGTGRCYPGSADFEGVAGRACGACGCQSPLSCCADGICRESCGTQLPSSFCDCVDDGMGNQVEVCSSKAQPGSSCKDATDCPKCRKVCKYKVCECTNGNCSTVDKTITVANNIACPTDQSCINCLAYKTCDPLVRTCSVSHPAYSLISGSCQIGCSTNAECAGSTKKCSWTECSNGTCSALKTSTIPINQTCPTGCSTNSDCGTIIGTATIVIDGSCKNGSSVVTSQASGGSLPYKKYTWYKDGAIDYEQICSTSTIGCTTSYTYNNLTASKHQVYLRIEDAKGTPWASNILDVNCSTVTNRCGIDANGLMFCSSSGTGTSCNNASDCGVCKKR